MAAPGAHAARRDGREERGHEGAHTKPWGARRPCKPKASTWFVDVLE